MRSLSEILKECLTRSEVMSARHDLSGDWADILRSRFNLVEVAAPGSAALQRSAMSNRRKTASPGARPHHRFRVSPVASVLQPHLRRFGFGTDLDDRSSISRFNPSCDRA